MSHEILFVLLAAIFGLTLTWSVGANDLANILSPTIGSKAINIRQAILIAMFFELGGALLGGGKVAATVQHGIINLEVLNHDPNIIIYGMLAALLASTVWITMATHFGIPVSLTNSIVGAIVGFGLLVLGWHAVHWRIIGFIGLSWLVCPIIASFISFLLFFIIQRLILSSAEPLKKAKRYLPFFLFFVGFVLAEMTIIKGLMRFDIHLNIFSNIFIASFSGLFIIVAGQMLLKRIYRRPFGDHHEQFILVEKSFSILMLFTICAMVYAHGSDDIATSTGPVAAVIGLVHAADPRHNGNLLLAILTCGYIGVVIGFLTYGRKVVGTVGSSITELTPSRSFCATIAAATTIVTSTNIGIPVSATQTLVGAILGVGLARGIGALDLRVIRNIFASWFITVPITAIFAASFFYIFKLMFFTIQT